MKLNTRFDAVLAIATLTILPALVCRAAETNAAPERIGIYDSRAIAYAYFWSESHQRKLSDTVRAAKDAKAAGDTNRFTELNARSKAEQERNHLQVFSTASVEDLLMEMPEQVTAAQKGANITTLVSKWDEQTLKEHPGAKKIDVTDLLLRDFKLTDKQRKVIADIRKKRPLPIDQAQKLLKEGKL